jgi:hypothetical protein
MPDVRPPQELFVEARKGGSRGGLVGGLIGGVIGAIIGALLCYYFLHR